MVGTLGVVHWLLDSVDPGPRDDLTHLDYFQSPFLLL